MGSIVGYALDTWNLVGGLFYIDVYEPQINCGAAERGSRERESCKGWRGEEEEGSRFLNPK